VNLDAHVAFRSPFSSGFATSREQARHFVAKFSANHLHGIGRRDDAQSFEAENEMTYETTALAGLEKEGRLVDAVYKGPSDKAGYLAYRGDFALKMQESKADEKRPPEFCLEQGLAIVKDGGSTIDALAGYIHDINNLHTFKDVMGALLSSSGNYIIFAGNIDFLSKYTVSFGDATLTVLPLEESTVWKELSDLSGLDKNDFKKLDGGGKVQLILDKAAESNSVYEKISFEDFLTKALPVRNRNENRPV
jgi:hypothetical protein